MQIAKSRIKASITESQDQKGFLRAPVSLW